jgi:hypothetical protein
MASNVGSTATITGNPQNSSCSHRVIRAPGAMLITDLKNRQFAVI